MIALQIESFFSLTVILASSPHLILTSNLPIVAANKRWLEGRASHCSTPSSGAPGSWLPSRPASLLTHHPEYLHPALSWESLPAAAWVPEQTLLPGFLDSWGGDGASLLFFKPNRYTGEFLQQSRVPPVLSDSLDLGGYESTLRRRHDMTYTRFTCPLGGPRIAAGPLLQLEAGVTQSLLMLC